MSNKIQDSRNADYYQLLQFTIRPIIQNTNDKSVSLLSSVYNWSITESMDSPYLYGEATIVESTNQVYNFPFLGEEILDVEYIDFYGDKRSESYFVYSVDSIEKLENIKEKTIRYKLHFCSIDKFLADTQRVQISYSNIPISDMASLLFEQFYTDKGATKEIVIEETTGNHTLVIPNLRPDEAMMFLARRAYSSYNNNSMFHFFETRDKFFFCTYQFLVEAYKDKIETDEKLRFIHNTINSNSPVGQLIAAQSFANIKYGTKVNTVEDIKSRAYRRKVTEIDLLNLTIVNTDFDYFEDLVDRDKNSNNIDKVKPTHTKDFVNQFMNDVETTLVIKDYPAIGLNPGIENSLRAYPYYAENYNLKGPYKYHQNINSVSLSFSGRSTLFPGMLVNIEVPRFQAIPEKIIRDEERSGKYLVTSVNHLFIGDTYNMSVSLTKGGLGRKPNENTVPSTLQGTVAKTVSGLTDGGAISTTAPLTAEQLQALSNIGL